MSGLSRPGNKKLHFLKTGRRPFVQKVQIKKLISTKKGSFVMLQLSKQPHNVGAKDGGFELSWEVPRTMVGAHGWPPGCMLAIAGGCQSC